MNKYLQVGKYFGFIEKKLFGWQRIYSQCGEDLILDMMIGKKNGFCVDVGGNDPRHYNNTYYFYRRGWRGINVEPNVEKFLLFKKWRRRDININAGIAQAEGDFDFYDFKEDTLSTFSPQIAMEYQEMGHMLKRVVKIPLLPLAKVLEQNLPTGQIIDFMSIDTEGYDLEVLKSNDWQKYRPLYIVLESLEYKKDGSGKKLNQVFDEYMIGIDYEKVADTFLNSIYKDKKYV